MNNTLAGSLGCMGRLDPRPSCGAPRWWAIRKLTCGESRAGRGPGRAMLNNVLVLINVTKELDNKCIFVQFTINMISLKMYTLLKQQKYLFLY